MSYKALELRDGRVALLHPDTPVVFAVLEVQAVVPSRGAVNGVSHQMVAVNATGGAVDSVVGRPPRRAKKAKRTQAPPPRTGGGKGEAKPKGRPPKNPEAVSRARELRDEDEDRTPKEIWEQMLREGYKDLKYSDVWKWLNR